MKSGIKTTEFWATIGAILAAILIPMLSAEQADKVVNWAEIGGIVGTCLAAGCYALARGLAKKGNGGG